MVVVVGLGNVLRRDDGIGLRVLEHLRASGTPPGVKLVEGAGAGADILFEIDSADKIVFVDAVRSGGVPGSLCRLSGVQLRELSRSAPETESERLFLSHGVTVSGLLRAAEGILDAELASRVVFFGMEADSVEYGTGLSPMVSAALPTLVEYVRTEIEGGLVGQSGSA